MPDDPHASETAYRILPGSGGPLVLASPHSGRDYPAAFLARTRLTINQLRRAEDPFVDELLAGAAGLGVPLIAARYGRAYLDLNRDPRELDPAMFIDPPPPSPYQSSERVAAGLGVLPRIAAQGLDIYPGRLRLAEAQARIERVHAPYHAALARLIARAREHHGYALLLDCHSMPTPPTTAAGAPQFVLGDLHGRAATAPLVEVIEAWLGRAGFRVARNIPYAGGFTTTRHADPAGGVHVVQIEIDRALYMDPARLTRHAGFAAVSAALTKLVRSLLDEAAVLGLASPHRLAAE